MSLTPLRPSIARRQMALAEPGQLRRLGVVVTLCASAFAMSSLRTGAPTHAPIGRLCDAPATMTSQAVASCWPR